MEERKYDVKVLYHEYDELGNPNWEYFEADTYYTSGMCLFIECTDGKDVIIPLNNIEKIFIEELKGEQDGESTNIEK